MNLFQWLLFYVYSGVALGGMMAAKSDTLFGLFTPDNEFDSPADIDKRRKILGRMVTTACEAADMMASHTTNSLIGSYNTRLLETYNNSLEKQATANILKVVPPANNQGD